MKKSEIIFSSILVPIDYALLVLAGMSAYFARYSRIYTENIREVVFSLPLLDYLKFVYVFAAIWIAIFAMAGLFSMRPPKKVFSLLNKIFLACSTGTLFVIVVFFFSRELFSSRFIILAVWFFGAAYISIAHMLVRYIQLLAYKKGIGVHRIVLVGSDRISQELRQEFKNKIKLGYKVIYQAEDYNDDLKKKVSEFSENGGIDEIIQADPNFSRQTAMQLIDLANEYNLDFKYAADLLGARRTNIQVNTISGIPIIEIQKTPLDGWGRVVKRFFDVIGSLLALVILTPVFLILSIIIKFDSKGPAIYRTERIGSKGKKFYLYKFRSMIVGADEMKEKLMDKNERFDGPLFKMENDPRITLVGKFLRRTSFDELPNFWNVLAGNMSLVGPRPHEPKEVEKYQKHHKKLLNIKPGITGLAQVSGRSTLDFETEVKLDTLYIETWSLNLDILILFKTPFVVMFFKTAA
ncbi:MAG: sugar transferase [Candidatus Kuenenbacteria bacterium]